MNQLNLQNYSVFESLKVCTQPVEQTETNSPRELILVDPSVKNSDRLVAEVLESRENCIVEIRVLETDQDGIFQISQLLWESDNKYNTVYIIADNAQGQITIGTSLLTIFNLNEHADRLVGWTSAFSKDVTLYFYGSDFSNDAVGEQLANAISATLGATLGSHDRCTLPIVPR